MDDDKTRTHLVLSAGTRVSHYKIIDRIGAGGMGEVFLAEDTKLHRRVALKFLPAHCAGDEDMKRRFLREAEAAASLNHPNIITRMHPRQDGQSLNDSPCLGSHRAHG